VSGQNDLEQPVKRDRGAQQIIHRQVAVKAYRGDKEFWNLTCQKKGAKPARYEFE
jgi:hypothetical protein